MIKQTLSLFLSTIVIVNSPALRTEMPIRRGYETHVFSAEALAPGTITGWKAFGNARWKTSRQASIVAHPSIPWSYLLLDFIERPVVWVMYWTYPWRTGRLSRSTPMYPPGPRVLHILVSYPRDFAVRWNINAHMDAGNKRVHRIHAALQWENLMRTVRRLGVEIDEIDQGPGLHDMVFTANGGVVHEHIFVPPHFANNERQKETPLFTEYFRQRGYTIDDIAKGSLWEGEGDTLVHDDTEKGLTRFGGYGSVVDGFRSNIAAQAAVARHLNQRFVGLALIDPLFYHLDTCFFPLGDGRSALYYPGAFSDQSLELIRRYVSNPIPISEKAAVLFPCNGVVIGKTLVINQTTPILTESLRRDGFSVVETPTSEFLKSGGSVKCLMLLMNGWLRPRPELTFQPKPLDRRQHPVVKWMDLQSLTSA